MNLTYYDNIQTGLTINLIINRCGCFLDIIEDKNNYRNYMDMIKQKETLLKSGRKDLWDIIEDEYYSDIEEIKRYSEQVGCEVNYKHVVNFTWLLQIVKK